MFTLDDLKELAAIRGESVTLLSLKLGKSSKLLHASLIEIPILRPKLAHNVVTKFKKESKLILGSEIVDVLARDLFWDHLRVEEMMSLIGLNFVELSRAIGRTSKFLEVQLSKYKGGLPIKSIQLIREHFPDEMNSLLTNVEREVLDTFVENGAMVVSNKGKSGRKKRRR